MKNQNRRDDRRRTQVRAHEVERRVYKALAQDMALSVDLRRAAALHLASLPRRGALCRVRNRCVLTGRPRAVYKRFQLSRLCFRDAASRGLLPGVFKASW